MARSKEFENAETYDVDSRLLSGSRNMRGWSTSNNLEQQAIAGANRQRYYEVRR